MVNQKLKLYSSKFTPVDGTLIPTGELRDVKGTPMDFTEFKAIGKEIDAEDEQLKFKKQVGKEGCAYDDRHGFCLESQYCPDAVNNPAFESPILKAGETYRTRTVYQFSID